MSISSDISSLINTNSDVYTARAALDGNAIDPSTSSVTGDRTSGLFKDASTEMGKDDFLLLLVTQLKYQDPLSPMENTDFVAQLAQFRSLESSSNIETAINGMKDSLLGTVEAQSNSAQSLTNSSSVSLIGKNVRMQQTSTTWRGAAGEKIPLNINLGSASSATIHIVNSDGEIIKDIIAESDGESSTTTIEWDGTDNTGNIAKPGTYDISIDNQENNPELYAFVQDTVSGVRFTAEGTMIKVGGKELSVGNIIDVSSENESNSSGVGITTAVELIGKQVRVRQNSVKYNQQDNENVNVKINTGGRSVVKVNITNSLGEVVYSTNVNADSNGIAVLNWGGESLNGKYVSKGNYNIVIEGANNDPSLYGFKQGLVTGVTNIGGNALLKMGNTTISLSDIIAIDSIDSGEIV